MSTETAFYLGMFFVFIAFAVLFFGLPRSKKKLD
jgi:hypothetical protein